MGLEQDVSALSVLVEPQRRRLYDALARAATPRTLGELCKELGLGRTLAAFHVEKLAEAGLVESLAPEPAPGQPGRPSRRLRLTGRELTASVPPRRYDLVAEVLLAAATDQRPGETLDVAARRCARARGAALADELKPARRTASRRRLELLLGRLGYTPERDGDTVLLRNCPFDRLRATDQTLVCNINHALAQGYLDGVGADDLTAELRPCAHNCCVVIRPAAAVTRASRRVPPLRGRGASEAQPFGIS